MTIDTPALPSSYGWGFVVGQIIEAIADQSGDGDRFPESRPVLGRVVFEPLTPLRKVSTPVALFVAHKNVVAELNDNGEIIDADGYAGVWLVTGSYRVSFKLVDAEIKAFNIEVTSAHTISQPLNLATAAPYIPENGSGGIGGATRGLIITAANVATIPPGTVTDNLAAYYNSGAAPITVAGVELAAGSHAVWAWVAGAWVLLSSGTSTPPVNTSDTTAPVWSATLTTGAPTDTAVVIAATALATDNVAVTGYRWRLTGESADIARTITPSGLNFTLDGLTASTAYAAPIFWAVDAGGNKSAELTAPGFTTAAPASVWTTLVYDTFTDADDVLATAHTPDMGTWSPNNTDELVIRSNALALRAVTRDWPDNGLGKAITTGSWSARTTLDYNFANTAGGLAVSFTCGLSISVRIAANGAVTFGSETATATETTGNTTTAPATGTIVVELTGTNQTDGVLTCTINGTLYRRWEDIVWNGQGSWGIGPMLTGASFAFGGDVYVGGGGYSAVSVSSARIEQR